MNSTTDINGRAWAKLSQVKVHDLVELDSGFTCRAAGKARLFTDDGKLYFRCGDGQHFIDGQADDGEHLVGIYACNEVVSQKID